MTFTNVDPTLLTAQGSARADGQPRTEASHTAEPSHAVETTGRFSQRPVVEARVCGYCGHRDRRWNGTDEQGWDVHDGWLACPDCLWIEPWNDKREAA